MARKCMRRRVGAAWSLTNACMSCLHGTIQSFIAKPQRPSLWVAYAMPCNNSVLILTEILVVVRA